MLIKGQLHKQDYMADQNTLMIRTLGSVLYCTEQNILQLTTASKNVSRVHTAEFDQFVYKDSFRAQKTHLNRLCFLC